MSRPDVLPPFNPTRHGFVLLPNHQPPGGVRHYEYRNHAFADGIHNYHRLNLYLTQDGDFVTIWFGLLESIFLDELFGDMPPPEYDEPLFRGHIESEEQARHILKALRPETWGAHHLRRDAEHGIVCEMLETIRAAAEQDADAISTIHVEGWRVAYTGVLPDDFLNQLSIPKRAEFWKQEIAAEKNFVRVAVHDGAVLGWISGGPSRDDDAKDALEIYALYVNPHFWRRGIGRRLMDAALEEFARPNVPITLWVLTKNRSALEFYRKLGFAADGAVKEIFIGGVALDEIRLRIMPQVNP